MIAAALNVERDEIEPAGARRAKQEVAHVVDDLRINFFGPIRGKVLQHRIDARFLNQAGIEEGVAQFNAFAHLVAVVVEEFDVGAEHAVADAEPDRGKLVGDARVDVGVVARIGLERPVAEQGGDKLLVGDHLKFGDHDATRLLEDLLIGKFRMGFGDTVGQTVVFAEEERLHGDQFHVLVHAKVAGEK